MGYTQMEEGTESGKARNLKLSLTCHFQRKMPDIPMRYIHFDVSKKESYSLDSVGKHGFGMFCISAIIL